MYLKRPHNRISVKKNDNSGLQSSAEPKGTSNDVFPFQKRHKLALPPEAPQKPSPLPSNPTEAQLVT